MNEKQNWEKALKESGCKYSPIIKKARHEVLENPPGIFYEAVVVYLEKEYPTGSMRAKAEVDIELLKIQDNPVLFLCGELKSLVDTMEKEASIETGSENNRPA